jgi:hypothetical protein
MIGVEPVKSVVIGDKDNEVNDKPLLFAGDSLCNVKASQIFTSHFILRILAPSFDSLLSMCS